MHSFKILTYNIHKGFGLGHMKASLQAANADLVFLQEIRDYHHFPTAQFTYLADPLWSSVAYGKNVVSQEGSHGNAILSKSPIEFSKNEDISLSSIERRGLLYAKIKLDHHPLQPTLHAFCVHLGLFEKDRLSQTRHLIHLIQGQIPEQDLLVIAGDFNDWRGTLTPILISNLNVQEAFLEKTGAHALSFPSFFPILRLDRIYYRNLRCLRAKAIKESARKNPSDHLALLAEFSCEENLTFRSSFFESESDKA